MRGGELAWVPYHVPPNPTAYPMPDMSPGAGMEMKVPEAKHLLPQ